MYLQAARSGEFFPSQSFAFYLLLPSLVTKNPSNYNEVPSIVKDNLIKKFFFSDSELNLIPTTNLTLVYQLN